MSDREYTLDDLVRETGFTKRQIRFYITKKLVPGAGDSRGPYAAYAEETLQRLLLVRDLKDQPVGPTGRTMTLDEIAHALDSLDDVRVAAKQDAPEIMMSMSAEILEEKPADAEPRESTARDYLRHLRRSLLFRGTRDEDVREAEESQFALRYSLARAYEETEDSGPELHDLLGRLQALLAELGSDTRYTKPQGDAGQWLRVTTPDVEFHVRKPDDHVARTRLGRLARALARLLEREE